MAHDRLAELVGYRNELATIGATGASEDRASAVRETIAGIEGELRERAGDLRKAAASLRKAGLDGQADRLEADAAHISDLVGVQKAPESAPKERAVKVPTGGASRGSSAERGA